MSLSVDEIGNGIKTRAMIIKRLIQIVCTSLCLGMLYQPNLLCIMLVDSNLSSLSQHNNSLIDHYGERRCCCIKIDRIKHTKDKYIIYAHDNVRYYRIDSQKVLSEPRRGKIKKGATYTMTLFCTKVYPINYLDISPPRPRYEIKRCIFGIYECEHLLGLHLCDTIVNPIHIP